MSAENTTAQNCESVDLASVIEVESVENAKDGTTEINKEYLGLLKLVFNLAASVANEKEKDKSSAECIETLRETEIRLTNFRRTFDPLNAPPDDAIVLAQIYLKLSEVYYRDDNRRENLYIAREHLKQCAQLLKGKEFDRKAVLAVVKAFYELGRISIKLKNLDESERYTCKAVELYLMYTEKKDDYPVPVHFPTVTGIGTPETNYTCEMDVLYARALQILLLHQYYNVTEYSSIDHCTLIMYAHKILNKMSKTVPSSMSYTEWAKFSSQLALEFLKYKRFVEARHHLAAASLFTKKFHEQVLTKIDEDKLSTDKTIAQNLYTMTVAEIAIMWAKYGNTLLRSSGERLLYDEEKDESATDSAVQSPKLLFADLESELQNFTALIRDTYITDYKDAKAVFQRVVKWLEEAKALAAKGKLTKLYMDISRGIFHAYKYLASYEREKSEQMKLYKQLMDTLADLTKALNADDDINIRKYICLQLLIASYSLLEIKTEDLESHDKISAELSAEIDKLVKYNVHNSELYLYGTK